MIIRALPHVQKFIDSLPVALRADVKADLKDLQEHGLKAPLVELRQIQGKLWEIKTGGIRIFYILIDGTDMILLHAYKKQSQKAPKREIETALQRMKDFLEGEG